MTEFVRPRAVATLVAVADGSASLYFSGGGGILGAGADESVRMAASEFIEVAARSTEAFERAASRPLPQAGSIRFYLVRTDEVSTVEVAEEALLADASPLSEVFRKGDALISAIRRSEAQKPGA